MAMKVSSSLKIFFRRGDSGSLRVSSELFAPGDRLIFTIRKTVNGPIILQRVVSNFEDGSAIFAFDPKDTEKLEFGDYLYDMEYVSASGSRTHIIPPNPASSLPTFSLTKEVTYGG